MLQSKWSALALLCTSAACGVKTEKKTDAPAIDTSSAAIPTNRIRLMRRPPSHNSPSAAQPAPNAIDTSSSTEPAPDSGDTSSGKQTARDSADTSRTQP